MAGATELREQAQAKFAEAKALVEGIDPSDLDTETEQRFNATMDEAQQLLGQWQEKTRTEGNAAKLGDVMQFFNEVKGDGAPIPWTTQQVVQDAKAGKSLGQAFVESDGYKALIESGALESDHQSIKGYRAQVGRKAVDDVVSVGGGQGSAFVTPDYLPGTRGDLQSRPLTVRDLFANETTQSDTISYARLNAIDSGAAMVAEAEAVDGNNAAGGLKPQSSLAWQRVESPVEAVATWIAATRRTLADAGQIRGLIDNQLRIMLELVVEDQLLTGDGNSPNLEGILEVTGHQTLSAATAGIINPDAIRRAKRLVKTAGARVPADGLVIHPEDAEAFDTMKDGMGRYLFADPTSNAEPTPWGLRRVESEAVDPGTAIVGAFRVGATVFQREPITILTADQHADFFVRNLIVVLAEERLGFAIYYPASFVELTFQDWGAEAS